MYIIIHETPLFVNEFSLNFHINTFVCFWLRRLYFQPLRGVATKSPYIAKTEKNRNSSPFYSYGCRGLFMLAVFSSARFFLFVFALRQIGTNGFQFEPKL